MASSSRTVRVKFDGDATGLAATSKVGAKVVDSWRSGMDKVSRSFKRTGTDSGAALDKVNKNLVAVDSQIKATADRLAGLTKKFSETGDIKLFGDMSRDTTLLKKLQNVRKQLDDAGSDGGRGFVDAFSRQASSLMGKLPMGPWLAPAAAAAAPFLAATIGAAVTTGVALASVGAGLKIAFADPEVKAAGSRLGKDLGDMLKDAAKPFVPATLAAIETVRSKFLALKPELAGLFGDAAKYLGPLTDAATGFVSNLVPGLREANRNAEPLVATLGEHLPKAGAAASDALDSLSQSSNQSAHALDAVFTALEFGIRTSAANLDFFIKTMPVAGSILMQVVGSLDAGDRAFRTFAPASATAAAGVRDVSGAAIESVESLKAWAEQLEKGRQTNFTARSAAREYEAAIDAATEAVKRGGRAQLDRDGLITQGTEKGREYNIALEELAAKTNAASSAALAQTGSQERANAVLASGRQKFVELAVAMGMDAAAAQRLAGTLFAIPSPKVKVTVEQQKALDAIRQVQEGLGRVNSKNVTVGVYYVEHGRNAGSLKVPGGTLMKAGGGYVSGRGSGTSDSIPARLSDGEYVLRAAAVRELGVGFLNGLNRAGSGKARSVLADRDYLTGSGSPAAPAASSSAGSHAEAQVLQTHIHVGSEVTRVVNTTVSRESWRARVGKR